MEFADEKEQQELLDQQPPQRCRSCRASIVWLSHEKTGKPNCFDVPASWAGNALILPGGKYRIVSPGAGTLISHYATCPHAKDWRSG